MKFDEWIYLVCINIQNKYRKATELQDIFSSIDLFDAKLAFLDGVSPENYKLN